MITSTPGSYRPTCLISANAETCSFCHSADGPLLSSDVLIGSAWITSWIVNLFIIYLQCFISTVAYCHKIGILVCTEDTAIHAGDHNIRTMCCFISTQKNEVARPHSRLP